MIFVADFETRNSQKDVVNNTTSIWLWDVCDIEEYAHTTGYDMQSFLDYIYKIAPCTIYTHNLKFDGSFIIDYLLKNNYTYVEERKLEKGQFSCLISAEGQFYNIRICLEAKNKKKKKIVEFRDSSKKIAGSVRQIAISYGLPILKGEIEYTAERPEDYVATDEEVAYIHNDTEIVARVLSGQYEKSMTKLTSSGDAMFLYKTIVGKHFRDIFPPLPLDVDDYIRESYRGGVCQVNEKFKERIIDTTVYCYDVNSMYPAQMASRPLPYGTPRFYHGRYVENEFFPLYIQRIEVCCALRKNFRPTVLLKHNLFFFSNEYLTDTHGELITLTLTSVDLELLFRHYEIYQIRYIDGYMFRASDNLFKNYVLPLYDLKCKTKGAEKQTVKILLNSLYGKFAMNPRHRDKYPYVDEEDGSVKYALSEVTITDPYYTAVASFITAYARETLFNAIQANIEYFVYCDTDSVHITRKTLENAEIDDVKLGAFKLEKVYIKSKYLAQKTYYGIKADGNDLKIAGCPQEVKDTISFKDFDFGLVRDGKLRPKRVEGGTLLVNTPFSIHRR